MHASRQRRTAAWAALIILTTAGLAVRAATPERPAAAPTATARPLAVAPAAAGTAPEGARAYQEECASCHLAFPTRLLTVESWRAVMAGLGDHFGVDASIDAGTARAITAYLEQNAGDRRRGAATGAKPVLRITETEWFRREHHELTPAVLKRQDATSAADCSACHAGAARGEFEDEHRGRGERGEHGGHGEHGFGGHDRD